MKIHIHKKSIRRGFTLIELMVVIAILASLAAVAYGPIMKQMRKGAQNQALQNGKQIYTAMQDFRNDLGQFPCDVTAESLKKNSPDYDFGPLTGEYSNDYFRQLFYNRYMDDERNFYCEIQGSKKPDDKMARGEALTKGECGFGYVMKPEGQSLSLSGGLNLPIIVTTLTEGGPGDRVTFNGEEFYEKALVVRLDSSATWETLKEDQDGTFILETLFKEDRKGNPTGSRYVVLPPDM